MFTIAVLAQEAGVDPLPMLQMFFKAVVSGSVPANTVFAIVLVGLVMAIRKFGPALERILPDHTLVDKVLQFLFKSRPGGWLLNGLTTMSAALLAFVAADPTKSIPLAVWASSLGGAFTVAGVFEFLKDVLGWWKPAPAVAPVPASGPTAETPVETPKP